MPVVGQAIIQVRVLSDRLAADIRDAVKRGMDRAAPDIDKEGENAGRRMASSMGNGVRNNESAIGKELELAVRRGATKSGSVFDTEGDRLGQRFASHLGDGINDRAIWNRTEQGTAQRLAHILATGSLGRDGELLGGSIVQAIGRGLDREGPRTLRPAYNRSVVRELTSGSGGALVRAADVDGQLFMRNLAVGMLRGESDFNANLRRVFSNGVRDQNPDLANSLRRAIGDGVRGSGPRVTSEFRSALRDGARAATPSVGDEFARGAPSWVDSLVGKLAQGGFTDRFRVLGSRWGNASRTGFTSGNAFTRAGETAGNDLSNGVDRAVRRGVDHNRGGLLGTFGRLGGQLGKEFNLGIGAARMGQAAISGLVLIGPSIISGLGSVLTALAGEIINFAAAIGPGLAGALGVGLAGFSTLALNLGLLKLAFSGTTAQAKEFKAQVKTFKEVLTSTFAPEVLTGFSDLIANLKDNLLPAVGPLLKDTGTAMGNVARGFGQTLTSAGNLERIKGILSTNIVFLGNFKDGLSGLTTSFLILFNAAKPFVDFIGQGIKKFGEWAAASLAVSEGNGNLADFMNRMLQNFKDLAKVIGDFGAGIAGVFRGAAPAGKSLFDSISGIGEKFRAWTDNPANMDRMIKFFENARVISKQVFDLLGKIFVAGGNAFTNINPDKLQRFFDTLSKVGGSIAGVFSQIKTGAAGNLAKIFDDIAVVLDRAVATGSVEKFASAISTLALSLADLVVTLTANPIGAQIAGLGLGFLLFGGIIKALLSPVLLLGKALLGLAEGPILAGLSGIAAAVGAPVAAVVAAIAALVGIFVLAYANSQSLRDEIGKMVSLVGGAFSQVWDKIGPKVQALWEKIQALASAIGDRLAPVIAFIAPIVADAIRFIGELFGNIIDVISGFIDIVTGILTGNWQLIWHGVVEVLTAAWHQIQTVFGLILAVISTIWDTITTVIYNAGQVIVGIVSSIWTGVSDLTVTIWNAIYAFFNPILTAIADAIRAFGNGIPEFFSFIWGLVRDGAVTAWNAIFDFFNTIFTAIADAVRAFGNGIPVFFAFIWGLITDAAIAAWNAIYAFFETIFNTITGAIISFGNAIPPFLSSIWDWARQTVVDAWNSIFDFFNTILSNIADGIRSFGNGIPTFLSGIWADVLGAASTAWNAVKSAIVDPIVSAWEAVTGWIGKIKGIITDVISTVTGAVDTVTKALGIAQTNSAQAAALAATNTNPNAVSQANPFRKGILDPVMPDLRGWFDAMPGILDRAPAMKQLQPAPLSLDLLNRIIPALARGGIVSPTPGGTLVRLGEARRPERVDPIQRNGLTARDEALIRMMSAQLSGGGFGGNDVNVNVSLGERSLEAFVTSVIKKHDDAQARRVGRVRAT